jgi:hypothetical protein
LAKLVNTNSQFSTEHRAMMGLVMDAVNPKRRASVLQRAVNKLHGAASSSSSNKAGVASVGGSATTAIGASNNNGKGHIMISYNQKSAGNVARTVYTELTIRGFAVWVDFVNMANAKDITEEMAKGVDGAALVLILFTPSYKESGNCRMECTYAAKQQKPLIFLACDAQYTSPDGWLGITMGQALWIASWSVDVLESNKEALIRRIKETITGETSPTPLLATTATTSMGSHGNNQISPIDELRATVTRIEKQMLELKEQNLMLSTKLDQVLNKLGGR